MLPAQSRANRSQGIIGALSALLILLGPLAGFAAIFFGQRLFSKNSVPAPLEAPAASAPKQSPSEGALGIREKPSEARHATVARSDADAAPPRGCRSADPSQGLVTVAHENIAVMTAPSLAARKSPTRVGNRVCWTRAMTSKFLKTRTIGFAYPSSPLYGAPGGANEMAG